MSGPIKIDIGLGTSGVARGAKDAERALSDLEDAVADTGKGGARDLDKLEDELKDVQKQSKKTEDSMDDINRGSRKAFDGASDNVRGFKDEAKANFAEVASSFKGDLQGMADGVQGLTGGLASSLTPGIGIPVAILGAAAGAFLQSWITATEDSKRQVNEMYADFTENGQTFVSENYIATAIQQIQEDTGKWEAALQRSKDTGIDIGVVLRSMAGDQNAIADVHAAYVAKRDEELTKIRESGRSLEDQQVAVDAVNTKFGEQVEYIGAIQRDMGTAADKAQAYRDAMGGAAGNAATVKSTIEGIQDRSIKIGVQFDDAAFGAFWSKLQQRAAQGITVRANPGQGRFWE